MAALLLSLAKDFREAPPMKKLLSLLAGLAVAATGASAADFYDGKTIHIISSGAVGGGYTMHGRLLAPFLTKYTPGHPNVIVEAMPGGNGITAANHVFNIAPKDGTVIGVFNRDSMLAPILGEAAAKFRPDDFRWVGAPESYANNAFTMFIRTELPYMTFEDVRKASKPVNLGRQGNNLVTISKEVLGGNFNVIDGYRGDDIRLALERGEIDGMGIGYTYVVQQNPRWLSEKMVRPIVQFGHEKRLPEIPDVPTARELARTPDDLALIKFFELTLTLGFPFAMAPDVPADRVDVIRKAFDQAMNDPEYTASVKKANLDLSPRSGVDLGRDVEEAVKVSPAVLERAKVINRQGGG
jgi:tripartite-type tricarboxylate transporter receptor subunit TctC